MPSIEAKEPIFENGTNIKIGFRLTGTNLRPIFTDTKLPIDRSNINLTKLENLSIFFQSKIF